MSDPDSAYAAPTMQGMTEPMAVPFTARCDGCSGDAEWTTVHRGGRNVTTVACPQCGTAEHTGPSVVASAAPHAPAPAVMTTARAWALAPVGAVTRRSA
jgi:hypothetical protein